MAAPEADRGAFAYSATLIDGRPLKLDQFSGRVLLVVNTASECGFTPQFAELERIYRAYKDQGLTVLGFPCNQFAGQEPGSEEEIATFCQESYGVTFPMFEKIEVNGPTAHPLYRFMKAAKKGILGTERVKWNFTKFLVDRHGAVVGRFAPTTKPGALVGEIERLLQAAA